MTRIPFTKAHAAGDDVVVIEDADDRLVLGHDAIAALCHRRLGVGAGEMLRLVRADRRPSGPDSTHPGPGVKWFVEAMQADGGPARERSAGARVAARYLVDRGLAAFASDGTLAIATNDGVAYVRRVGTDLAIDLGQWRLAGGEPLVEADGLDVARPALGIELGDLYLVVALSSAEELEALDLARSPAVDPAPFDGANLGFVVPCDPFIADGVGRIEVRYHARDTGEAPAPAGGAAAAALAVRAWAGRGAPTEWHVVTRGGVSKVRMLPTVAGEHVLVSGPVDLTFSGTIDLAV